MVFKNKPKDPLSNSFYYYKDCYDLDFRRELFDRLAIKNISEKRETMRAIIYAAKMYDDIKYGLKEQTRSLSYQKQKFRKFKNSYYKFQKSLKDFEGDFSVGGYVDKVEEGFFDALFKRENSSNVLVEAIKKQYEEDEFYKTRFSKELLEFLSPLNAVIETIELKNSKLFFSKKGDAVSCWLSIIAEPWVKYSSVPLNIGHYYKEIGYKSDALDILFCLINKIDQDITREQVSTSLKYFSIAEAKRK